MYTRCPTCLTCFRVTEQHLAIANGKVRCGQCQHVFNAPENVIDDLPIHQLSTPTIVKADPSPQLEADAANYTSNIAPILNQEERLSLNISATTELTKKQDDEFEFSDIDSEENIIAEDELLERTDLGDVEDYPESPPAKDTGAENMSAINVEQAPAEVDVPIQLRNDIERLRQKVPRRSHPLLSLLFLIFLLVFSFAQLAYFRAFELTYFVPTARPLIETFCAKLNCHYSGPRDITKIQLLNRDVRIHPTEKNALLISASMINNATFAQPYPNVKIRLSDISGNVIAGRIFTAKTYMGQLNSPFSLMKSKIPVQLKFEVVDPGSDAVNFEFSFL